MRKIEERNGDIKLEVVDSTKYLKFCSKSGWMLDNLKEINHASYSAAGDLWIFSVKSSNKSLDCRYVLPASEVLLICEEEK